MDVLIMIKKKIIGFFCYFLIFFYLWIFFKMLSEYIVLQFYMFYYMINKDNLNDGFRRYEFINIVNDIVFLERLYILKSC